MSNLPMDACPASCFASQSGPVPRRPWFRLGVLSLLLSMLALPASAQPKSPRTPETTIDTSDGRLGYASVNLRDSTLRVAVRNIDITKFPTVGIVFDVLDRQNNFTSGVTKPDIIITENGKPQEVLSLSMITSTDRVPVDFVFLIDQTGSMGSKIDAVRQNIDEFTTRLVAKGIDYRLGLIVFDDNVAQRKWLTDNLTEFKGWISAINASGGGELEENALEALRAASGMNFRASANRCLILITDAPYHSYGSNRTMYTPETIVSVLNKYDLRTFCITSPAVRGYAHIAAMTGGQVYDIDQDFSDILSRFVTRMTSLYTATYRSTAELVPDSIVVEMKLRHNNSTSRKKFAVLEVGRKLIVDNILFSTNQHTLSSSSTPELDFLVRLMKARPKMKVKIEGHTDNVGDVDRNLQLSDLRAEAVRQYMIRRGISRDRLYTVGYGENRPTASNDTDEGRRLNRRTEFIIMQK
jgi:outer membrane protein OmpA-like peptidoglycan-associated protein/Mg-chelatase subunit ChlD